MSEVIHFFRQYVSFTFGFGPHHEIGGFIVFILAAHCTKVQYLALLPVYY